ncbi:MAG: hypothetical protein J6A28_01080, partial [Clostridia bacterium]|nr:hypothetical protein [Clostridia bacterium]
QRSAVRLIYIFENSSDDVIKITPMWTDLQDNLDSVSEEETTNNKNILVNCQHLNNLEDLPSEFLRDKSISLATAAGQRSCYLDSENKLQVIVVTIAVANVNRNAYCHSDNDGGLSFSIVTLPQEEQ